MRSNPCQTLAEHSCARWFMLATIFLSTAYSNVLQNLLAREHVLNVTAGDSAAIDSPVVFEVPTDLRGEDQLQLSGQAQTPIAVQWFRRGEGLAAFVLPAKLVTGQTLRFQLRPHNSPLGEDARASKSGDGNYLSLFLRSKEVLRYPLVIQQPPNGIEQLFAHSGHIHPLFTPTGRIVTAEFPADHAHQHAIFNAWVNTTFEGRKLDFWNQRAQTAKVEHLRYHGSTSGQVFAEFTVEMLHSDLIAPGGPKPVLKDLWTVRTWNVSSGFLMDIESRQTCIAQSPLTVEEYHYGGMSFRGREEWLGETASRFLTSDGKTRANGNHTRPHWVAIEGLIDGSPCSVAIMGHPNNFRHPEPVRLHPNKPYFVFTPPQLGKFDLRPGEEFVARYRYFVNDALAESTSINAVWNAYRAPPKTRVE